MCQVTAYQKNEALHVKQAVQGFGFAKYLSKILDHFRHVELDAFHDFYVRRPVVH
jgi:hypothetical protein